MARKKRTHSKKKRIIVEPKRNHLALIIAAIAIGLIIIVIATQLTNDKSQNIRVDQIPAEEEKPMSPGSIDNTFDEDEIKTTADGTKYIIDPRKIVKGIRSPGDVRDAIPSIDNPKYVSVANADEWIEDNELVLALLYKGEKRVYPLQILVFHEIVNDEVAGDPLLITYCPLCGSGIAYERTLNGEEVEFGTSGKLFNSNLVMYDRKTNTYWSQIEGKAIVGELTGTKLTEVSIDTVVWRDWKKAHPDSQVLSQDTGFFRNYGNDPYGNYYEDSFLIFDVENEDNRIHPKTVIFGIEVDGQFKAYKEDDIIEANGIIEDIVNGQPLRIERDEAGVITITNTKTGEIIVKERGFWFAWYAFHPETELFTNQ